MPARPPWSHEWTAKSRSSGLTRRLTFRSKATKVGDAVARFNKYNGVKIVVDGAPASVQMRGAFDANDPAIVCRVGAEAMTGCVADERDARALRIEPRERSP